MKLPKQRPSALFSKANPTRTFFADDLKPDLALVSKMTNFVSRMTNFVSKLMNCVSQMMKFVFKIMKFETIDKKLP